MGIIERIKNKVVDSADVLNDYRAAQVRVKYHDRWMERTREIGKPCDTPDDIDYSD